jgi:putative membrane protein
VIFLSAISSVTTYRDTIRKSIYENTALKIACGFFICVWAYTLSDIGDTVDWILENIPVFFWIGILIFTYSKFRFSDKSYIFILIFLALHVYGAKDVYSNNEFGNWLKQITGSSRNNYDRIVHFAFGLLISYAMLDLFTNYLKWNLNLSLTAVIVLNFAFGAFYEVLEWIVVAVFFPEQGSNFLGLQGDEWDSQKDIFIDVVGSLVFIVFILINERIHFSTGKNNFFFQKTVT